MQMRYPSGLLSNCCLSLTKTSRFKGPKLKDIRLKKTRPPKMRISRIVKSIKQHSKLSLDVDFTEMELVEVRLWYGKCLYSERSDIDAKQLFIVSLKTTKKGRKKKLKLEVIFHPESIAGSLPTVLCQLMVERGKSKD